VCFTPKAVILCIHKNYVFSYILYAILLSCFLNSDNLVREYKRKPYYDEENRLALVKACRYVDEAFIIDEFDNKPYIETFKIDAIVHGDDWEYTSYLEQIRVTPEFLEEKRIELVLLPYTKGISTSYLIKTIKEN
jgi:glycerol-3-phosphate cytidylyltransferase-like family protein